MQNAIESTRAALTAPRCARRPSSSQWIIVIVSSMCSKNPKCRPKNINTLQRKRDAHTINEWVGSCSCMQIPFSDARPIHANLFSICRRASVDISHSTNRVMRRRVQMHFAFSHFPFLLSIRIVFDLIAYVWSMCIGQRPLHSVNRCKENVFAKASNAISAPLDWFVGNSISRCHAMPSSVRSGPSRSHWATECVLLGPGIENALECDRLLCRLRRRQCNAPEDCSHCTLSFALNNFNEHFMINARTRRCKKPYVPAARQHVRALWSSSTPSPCVSERGLWAGVVAHT